MELKSLSQSNLNVFCNLKGYNKQVTKTVIIKQYRKCKILGKQLNILQKQYARSTAWVLVWWISTFRCSLEESLMHSNLAYIYLTKYPFSKGQYLFLGLIRYQVFTKARISLLKCMKTMNILKAKMSHFF